MKKKIGPLPVWGWGAAIALGVLIYWFRHNSSGQVAAGNATASGAVLDPTQGQLDMPAGLSSGGTSPDLTNFDPNAIADAVSNQLIPVLTTLPFASTPGEPQQASSGGDPVQQTVDTINALRSAGLIAPLPAASTGAATSQAQKHTTGKSTKDRTVHKNAKTGQTYKVENNPHGKPHGRYHVYGTGKSARYVKVK